MRIAIVGSSGSGKSTLARRVAERTGWPHIEFDRYYHQKDWTPQNPAVLKAQIGAELQADHWVSDGNYQSVLGDLVSARAETIVVYDLPRSLVTRQLVRRTIRRVVRREELWNGNREPLTNLTRWDPTKNVIRWSWTNHHKYRDGYRAAAESGAWAQADVVWVRRHRDAERWLDSLTEQ